MMDKKQKNQTLSDALIARGVRMTRQRKIVLDLLEHAAGHLDAAAVLEQARRADPGIDRATVYRTLSLLKRSGLIEELDLLHLGGKGHYYERRETGTHVHIGCVECGQIIEFPTRLIARLENDIQELTGYTVESTRVEVAGRCPRCSRKA
jgi:Fur family transcriptional regulator, ferric uptake regulator